MPAETPEQYLAPTLSPDTPGATRAQRWAIVPIPLLLLALIALWIANPQVVWPAPVLNWFIHGGIPLLGLALIVIPAARAFLANGQPSILMLGGGMLITNIGAVAMLIVMPRGLNPGFAIYNTSVLLSSVCCFIGVAVTSRRAMRVKHPVRWLACVYLGGAVVMALVILAAFNGRMPVYFIDGQGSTLLRSLVVGAAMALFLLTALLLLQTHRRAASSFLYWYALGMILLAVGLAGSLVIARQDSPLQWVTRFTQVFALVYMCAAVLTSARGYRGWTIPLASVEEAWRRGELLEGVRQQTPRGLILRYGLAVVSAATALGLRLVITAWIGPGLPTYITFLPAVMVVALLAGLLPGMLATAISGALTVYWLLPPIGISLVDRLGLALFTGMGLFMSVVAEYYHHYRDKAAGYERELALRESEARFHAAFAQGAVGMTIATMEGKILKANDVFCAMVGYPQSELMAHSALDITYPEDLPANLTGLRQLRHGKTVSFRMEKRYVHQDGHLVWVDMSTVVVRDAAGKPDYLVTHVVDITERKLATEALRQSEQRLARAEEIAGMGHWEWDLHADTMYWSPGIYRITEMPATGTPSIGLVLSMIHPDDREALQLAIARVLQGERIPGIDLRGMTANGELRNVNIQDEAINDADGHPLKLFGTLQDVTARTQAEEALRESEALFHHAVDNMPYSLGIYDAEQRFKFANPAALQQIGQPLEAIVGRRIDEIYDEVNDVATHSQFWPALRKAYQTGTPQTIECTVKMPTGQYDFMVTFVPMLKEDRVYQLLAFMF